MSVFGWSYPPGCSGPPEHYRWCRECDRTAEFCRCGDVEVEMDMEVEDEDEIGRDHELDS
jgi:hypothetical protein